MRLKLKVGDGVSMGNMTGEVVSRYNKEDEHGRYKIRVVFNRRQDNSMWFWSDGRQHRWMPPCLKRIKKATKKVTCKCVQGYVKVYGGSLYAGPFPSPGAEANIPQQLLVPQNFKWPSEQTLQQEFDLEVPA